MRAQYRLTPATVAQYPFIQFHAVHHNIILQPRGDPKKQALPTFVILKDADNEREIKYWPEEWLSHQEKVPPRQRVPQENPLENPN